MEQQRPAIVRKFFCFRSLHIVAGAGSLKKIDSIVKKNLERKNKNLQQKAIKFSTFGGNIFKVTII